MQKIHEEFLTDESGNKKAVVVPISEWQQIKEDLEELDDIRAYDKAKSKPSEPVPFDKAIKEIRWRNIELKYKLYIEKSAQKELSKIPHPDQNRIINAIRNLAEDPRPSGVKKLSGRDAWRIRVGKYRVIYEVYDDKLIILVISIGQRKDIYR